MAKNQVVLLLGSNHLNRETMLREARRRITELLNGSRWSTVIDSPDVKGVGDNYINQVVVGETLQSLEELTFSLKEIERGLGRTPRSKEVGIIEIDIDCVIFNDAIIRPGDYTKPYFTIPFSQLQ